jgi:hypothetical protein
MVKVKRLLVSRYNENQREIADARTRPERNRYGLRE